MPLAFFKKPLDNSVRPLSTCLGIITSYPKVRSSFYGLYANFHIHVIGKFICKQIHFTFIMGFIIRMLYHPAPQSHFIKLRNRALRSKLQYPFNE